MKTQAVLGHEFGPRLVKILGLPVETRSFELRVAVNEIVVVKCEYFAPNMETGELETILAEYELVKKGEGASLEKPDTGIVQPFDRRPLSER